MSQLLKPKQKVRTESSGVNCEAEQFLGGGGQGEVYRANLGGNPVALKWYFPSQATIEQRSALEVLVKQVRLTQVSLAPRPDVGERNSRLWLYHAAARSSL